MLTALLLAAVAEPPLGPLLPPGTNRDFLTAALAVEDRLYASDFAGAARSARLLPRKSLTVRWNDTKVPKTLRKEFAAQRDAALKTWSSISRGTIKVGSVNPDVEVSFEPVLATPPGASIPAGATLFVSQSPTEPRLEVVIGLKRGRPLASIDPVNVRNEVAHALGYYFGLETQQWAGTLMGRTDENVDQATIVTPGDFGLMTRAMRAADALREAVRQKQRLTPTRPRAFLQPAAVSLGPILHGEKPPFSVQVTNNGNAPLAMRIATDCFCVAATGYEVVEPGSTAVIKGTFDTKMAAPGPADHKVVVTTNDPETMSRAVAVRAKILPRYRLLTPGGDTAIMPTGSGSLDVFLVLDERSEMTPEGAELQGVQGDVQMEPWSGTLADPELGEATRPRKGYRLRVRIDGPLAPGRTPLNLVVRTDHEVFPELVKNLYAQRGIVALPMQVYMGELGPSPRRFAFQLSRPGKPFKVLGVRSDWERVKLSHQKIGKGDQHRVSVSYLGNARPGPVQGAVIVRTDDPKEPEIRVPLRATVR